MKHADCHHYNVFAPIGQRADTHGRKLERCVFRVWDRKQKPLEVKLFIQDHTASSVVVFKQTGSPLSCKATLCHVKTLERSPTGVQPHLLLCSCAEEGHTQVETSFSPSIWGKLEVTRWTPRDDRQINTNWCLSSGFHSNPPEHFIPSWAVPMTQHLHQIPPMKAYHLTPPHQSPSLCMPPPGTLGCVLHIIGLNNFL